MFDFDLNDFEASAGGAIPKGKYQAQVEKSEVEDTKAGGLMVAVMFSITGEKYNGAKVFRRFNVKHENPEVVKIGVGQIKSLIVASGGNATKFTDPSQLVGLECMINVGVEEYEGNESNTVKSFSKIKTDAGPMQMNEQPAQTQAAPEGANGKPPF